MWPGNRLGTARAGFAAGCRACAVDDIDFAGPGIAAAT
jgi:hypothetical protein